MGRGSVMKSSLIDTLCIEVTARCPLACIHCSAHSSPKRAEFLPAALLSEQLQTLPRLHEIYLSGGEPFEHPDILPLIRAASRVASRVIAYSSGTLLRDHPERTPLPEPLLAEARHAGLGRIDFSLYSTEGARHDAVTQTPGSLGLTLESLRNARRAGLPFGVHFVVMKSNAGDLEAVRHLAADLGAARVHVLALAPQGRASARFDDLTPGPVVLGRLEQPTRLEPEPRAPELVLSSALRPGLPATERDGLRTAFMDVQGFLYPDEGKRTRAHRTADSLLSGRSLPELLQQLQVPDDAPPRLQE